MAAATWDANTKAAGITLTGSNKIATSASGTNPGVFCTRTITSLLTYWELVVTTQSSTYSVGLANRSWNDASGTILGGDANGVGFSQAGAVKLNNVTLTTIFTFTAADVLQFAYRSQDRSLFIKKNNAGNWNNTVGADPVTNTSGIDISSMSFGTLLPAFGAIVASSQACTCRFSAADFGFTAPTGFVTIDTSGASGVGELVAATPTFNGAARKDPTTETNQFSAHPGSAYGNYSGTTNISGNVKENNVNVSGKKVILIDRNGLIIGVATSDGSGNYTIKARGRNATVAIALDDPTYDALVYDEVVPV